MMIWNDPPSNTPSYLSIVSDMSPNNTTYLVSPTSQSTTPKGVINNSNKNSRQLLETNCYLMTQKIIPYMDIKSFIKS